MSVTPGAVLPPPSGPLPILTLCQNASQNIQQACISVDEHHCAEHTEYQECCLLRRYQQLFVCLRNRGDCSQHPPALFYFYHQNEQSLKNWNTSAFFLLKDNSITSDSKTLCKNRNLRVRARLFIGLYIINLVFQHMCLGTLRKQVKRFDSN